MPTPTEWCCGNYGPPLLTRRELLRRAGLGFGSLALAHLLLEDGLLSAEPAGGRGSGRGPRANGRPRSVIFLFMGGGPTQVDPWAPKPLPTGLNGRNVPESIARHIPRIA